MSIFYTMSVYITQY